MVRFLWLHNWSVRAIVWTWLAGAGVLASWWLWPANPLRRLPENVAFGVLMVAAWLAILLPGSYVVDRARAWIEAREERLGREP